MKELNVDSVAKFREVFTYEKYVKEEKLDHQEITYTKRIGLKSSEYLDSKYRGLIFKDKLKKNKKIE